MKNPMKNPTNPGILALVCTIFLLISCQKEVSTDNAQETRNVHASGAVADSPEKIAGVPTIISSDYIKSLGSVASANPSGERGKRSIDVTPPSVSITSPTNGATV